MSQAHPVQVTTALRWAQDALRDINKTLPALKSLTLHLLKGFWKGQKAVH